MAATLTKEQILDGIAELSVIELSELLKEFEEKFGVTAAAPVAVAAPAAAGGGAEAGAGRGEERLRRHLDGGGEKKIQVIKEVRALTNLGLKEAKDLVDGAPKPVLGEGLQGRRRQGQGCPRGRRRHGRSQVVSTAYRGVEPRPVATGSAGGRLRGRRVLDLGADSA